MKSQLLFTGLFFSCSVYAQISSISNLNTINTAVPFLGITPDARAGGTGDAGIALSADCHSIFWNTAKLASIKKRFGFSATYTPWLKNLVSDIFLFDASAYWKIDSSNAVTVSFRGFKFGEITFTDNTGTVIGNVHPFEFTSHVGYSRKLSSHFYAGLNLGFAYSDLVPGHPETAIPIKPASAAMVDLSFFYSHPVASSALYHYNIGLTISNFGNKITYNPNGEIKDFLPANLGVGGAFNFTPGKKDVLTATLNLSKLLVPTPDTSGAYRNQSVFKGAINSFSDAPDGFKEEFHEINWALGVEYVYDQFISLRSGYFYEHLTKGDRHYATFGLGMNFNALEGDVSYLITSKNNPLNNSFRVGLTFHIDSFRHISLRRSQKSKV